MSSDRFPELPPAPLFDHLPAACLGRLRWYARICHFGPDELIVQQGEPNEWLHLITKGQVVLEHPSREAVERLGPGEVIGEEGCLAPGLPSSSARAATSVETLRFQHYAIAWALLGCQEAIPIFADALPKRGAMLSPALPIE